MKRILFGFFLMCAVCTSAGAVSGKGLSRLTVMSYNIRMGEADDGTNSWALRYPATAMMIEDQKPDIFGVQEAYDYQVNFIAENCRDYKCVGVGREDGKSKGEHMSVFYNRKVLSLVKWGTFWLSETPDKPSKGWDAACKRTATWAIMKERKSGNRFLFVNTHFDHKGRKAQEEGAALVLKMIESINRDNLPVVLTGDFNLTPDDPSVMQIDRKMKSARKFAGETDSKGSYNGWGRSSSIIDYVYYSGFTSCLEFRTVDKPYAERKFISDHYPVMAVLIF